MEREHRRDAQDSDALVPFDDLLDQLVSGPTALKLGIAWISWSVAE